MKPLGKLCAGAAMAAALVACASVEPPTEAISRAELSVRKADEAQASQYAALDLVKAREKLEKARVGARDEDTWEEARRLAEQANVDAELAEEKARAAVAARNAAQMKRSLETLQSELARRPVER